MRAIELSLMRMAASRLNLVRLAKQLSSVRMANRLFTNQTVGTVWDK
jgi:hypothetical protein